MMIFFDPMVKSGLIFKNVDSVVLNHVSVQGALKDPVDLEHVSSYKNV